jgi:HD superfamily phosphohydrolase YqeK
MKLKIREKKVYEWLIEFYNNDGKRIDAAHKLDHILRVLYWAIKLQKKEGGDIHNLIPAVLLHDIGQAWDESEGQKMHAMVSVQKAPVVLEKCGYSTLEIEKICETIELHSSRFASKKHMTNEGKIIYDADKIDASDLSIIIRTSKKNDTFDNKGVADLILSWIKKWRSKSDDNIFYTKTGRKIGIPRMLKTESFCQKIIKEENIIFNYLHKISD